MRNFTQEQIADFNVAIRDLGDEMAWRIFFKTFDQCIEEGTPEPQARQEAVDWLMVQARFVCR